MKTTILPLCISFLAKAVYAIEFQVNLNEYGKCQTEVLKKGDFQYHLGINRPYCQYHSECQDLWFRYTCRFPTTTSTTGTNVCAKDPDTQQTLMSHDYYATTDDAVTYVENQLNLYPEWAYDGSGSLHTKIKSGAVLQAPDCGNSASVRVIYYKAGCYGDNMDIFVNGELKKEWNVVGSNALLGSAKASTDNMQLAISDDLCEKGQTECLIHVFQGKELLSDLTSTAAGSGNSDGELDGATGEACSEVWFQQALLAASSSNVKLVGSVVLVLWTMTILLFVYE